jgi:hypothetical protein
MRGSMTVIFKRVIMLSSGNCIVVGHEGLGE